MKHVLTALAVLLPTYGIAQTTAEITQDAVDNHALPRFHTLAVTAADLSTAAANDCTAASPTLRDAYGTAFDAWIAVNHMRFGPTETEERGFALAFWPDSRGATPKALATLIRDEDPIALSADAYTDMSIAARGFYTLEFLLFDDTISAQGDDAYRCQLVQTITTDIAILSGAINEDWSAAYADSLKTPTDTGIYRNDAESVQQIFKALNTGLQLLSDTRLGRPLGTFDRPRPTRAEVWRSGRTVRHIDVTLHNLRDLAHRLSAGDDTLQANFDAAFDKAITQTAALPDPILAAVADPGARIKVEALRTSVEQIRALSGLELGPKLGVAAGFNSLDGD